jgi:uncharacterized protein YfaS (alpha-2-macroglobulin family)
MRRDAWLSLIVLAWVMGGLAALIHSEHPRGRVVGKVITAESGQALEKAEVWFDHPQGTWKVRSKKDGYFELPNLPAGTYTVTASTYAHKLEAIQFTLREGETRNLLIALEPVEPFLELIHPQTVFHPDETVKVGVRGFVPSDELRIQVWQVQMEKTSASVPLTSLLNFLEEVRNGWWRGVWELRDALQRISPCLTKVSEMTAPITQRDGEGVFMQFVPVPLPSEGTYLVRISVGSLERIALVELTRVGLIVKVGSDRNGKPSALVFAADLKTGEPIKDVEVSVWVKERLVGRESDKLVASSVTDANGLAQLPLSGMSGETGGCFFVASKRSNAKILPIAWVALSEYELRDLVTSGKSLLGTIYTDRPVYRPGNKVHFKGIVREQTPNGYRPVKLTSRPSSRASHPESFDLFIRDPDGNIVHRTQVALNDFGSFSGSFTLNDEAPTGTYTVEAVPQGNGEGSKVTGSFVVAAYRKPEVQVTVKPERRRFSRSEKVTVTVSAQYYFGMPVAGARVLYIVSRLPVVDEQEGFEWGEGYGGETVLEGETKTNSAGQAVISFRPSDLPSEAPSFSEFRYEVYVGVSAAGYQFAEGSTNFLVTQGDWKLTVSCEPSFVGEGETVTAKAKVTHWDTQKPQANAVIRWRAGTMEWAGEETKIRWKLNGESETDGNGEAKWQFVPDESGDWVVEAVVQDQRRNSIGAEKIVWVVPRREAPTLPPKLPPLQLWLDKPRYRAGEEAKIAVRSEVKGETVLVTVEGEKLHAFRLLKLRNGMAQWRFKVTNDLLPNAYVTASLVWRKKFAQESKPLRFDLDDFRLQVSVKSDRSVYEPRQTAMLTVQVRDRRGNPVKAEISIAVVDEAIYAIREDDPEQVFKAFYAERPNKTLTRYSFPWLAWQGDKGEIETVRRYFPDTALWLPHVITDEKGNAQVRLKVPDTLTQWRVTVVAHTIDTNVGYGVTKFLCAVPFGVRIAAPLVLTQNDQTTISAIVHNDTDRSCVATVEAQIRFEGTEAEKLTVASSGQGANFQFVSGQQPITRPSPLVPRPSPVLSLPPQTVTVRPNETATVKWDFVAERSGRFVITVRAKSDNGRTDAEQRVITVLPHAAKKVVSQTVMLSPNETARKLAIVLPPNADLWASQISVRLAPSIFSALLGALEYLATYPYGCVEQTMDSFLPDLLVWRVLKERGIKVAWLEKELPKMVQRGLARLYRFQHEDGGWGWWEDDETNLWMTSLVVRGLAEAKRAGFDVSEVVLAKGIKAIEEMLSEGWRNRDSDTVAFALFALSRAGAKIPILEHPRLFAPASFPSPQQPVPNEIVNRCSPYGLAFLTLALHEWQRPEAKQLAEKLLHASIALKGELRWSVRGSTWIHRWTTDDETTAWALLALMRTGMIDAELAAETVKGLLQNRKGDGWISTKDTAAILEAMLEFAHRFERGKGQGTRDKGKVEAQTPMTVTVSLNGSSQNLQLPPDAQFQPELMVRLTGKLKLGANEVEIRKPQGSTLWVTLVSKQALMLPERTGELLTSEQRMQRQYEKLEPYIAEGGRVEWRAKPLRSGDSVKVGDLIRVTLKVNCPTDFAVLEDPIPAGMRVFEGQTVEVSEGREYAVKPKEVRDDRTVTFFRSSGQYLVRYLLRAEVPGDYHILPPQLWHMYGAERWSGAEDRLRVLP